MASGRGGPGKQDDPVVVGVQDVTGVERDPPKVTGTSIAPAPSFALRRGFVPSALMPRSSPDNAALSRTAPAASS